MEFWNDEIIEKSWERLMELKNKINFILIGGWAVFIYTGRNKTKDIDIISDYNSLLQLKEIYRFLNKNERMKRYEIKLMEGLNINIYLPKYSKLVIPIEDIENLTLMKDGFILPKPEVLLILKIAEYLDNQNNIIGTESAINIASLVLFANCDFNLFKELIDKYKLRGYIKLLFLIIENFDRSLIKYLGLNQNEFAKLRKKYIEEIRKIL